MSDEPAVGETCPECNEVITPAGKQSPAMALGLHRRRAHDVKGSSGASARARAKREGSAPASAPASSSPLSLVTGALSETTGKGAPTSDQLTRTFAKIYGYGMYGMWGLVVDGDPGLETEHARAAALDMLAPTPDQATDTVRPFARLASGTSFNRRFGRTIVDNSDVVDCLAAIFDQVRAARAYTAARRAAAGGAPSHAAVTGAPPAPAGSQPMGERQGIIVTPGMLNRDDIVRAADEADS